MNIKNLTLISGLVLSTSLSAANYNGFIVKFKKGSAASLTSSNRFPGIEKLVSTPSGEFAKVKDLSSLSIESFLQNPDIEYIEPNYILTLPFYTKEVDNSETDDTIFAPIVNDPRYSKQWGFRNLGTNSGGIFSRGKSGEDINVEKAWQTTRGNKDLVVAVIDTGIDYTHPDLKNQMWANEAELNGKKGIDDDANGFVDDIYGYDWVNKDGDPMDDNDHGTHCAGNIGAEHNNNEGIAGVMGGVKLMGLKFLSKGGSGETIDAIEAVNYAVKMGAKVTSNSWGGDEYSKALEEAIANANSAGVLFIAAAGNESNNNDSKPTYPASYTLPNLITVASFTGNGSKSSFSNYGIKTVHIAAPGSSIYSTLPKGKYGNMSGTSMATPIAAGVAGLILSIYPDLTPQEVKEKLIKSSTVTTALDGITTSNGRVNAASAIE